MTAAERRHGTPHEEVTSHIVGTGSYIPPRRVPADAFLQSRFFADYDRPLDPATNPDIVSKFQDITEISERRWADDHLVTSDLARLAAEDALASSGVDPESLDYLIVAHNFGDVRLDNPRTDLVPTLAARVKEGLGIRSPGCIAYDLPFGCPGWLQAVIQADYFLRSGDARRAMVVGAETLSRVSDPHDRDSMLYADGAGAVILEGRPLAGHGILAHAARSDTLQHARLLRMDRSYDTGSSDGRLFLKMEGHRLYEYALRTVPGVVRQALDRAGVQLAEVRKIFLHQANGKMDKAIVSRLFRGRPDLSASPDLLPMTVSTLGNSSVATLPTLLDLVLKGRLDGHRLQADDVAVFASVGAGMNINALVYRLSD